MMRRLTYGGLAVLVLATTACGDRLDELFPTTPTPVIVTDTFSGTITPNGGATHSFFTESFGSVLATLTAVDVDPETEIGFGLGTWNGAVCQVVLPNDRAVQGTVVEGRVTSAGALCVRIWDVGNLTRATEYEITVEHP